MYHCVQALSLGTLKTSYSYSEVAPELGALATRLERLEVRVQQFIFGGVIQFLH